MRDQLDGQNCSPLDYGGFHSHSHSSLQNLAYISFEFEKKKKNLRFNLKLAWIAQVVMFASNGYTRQ